MDSGEKKWKLKIFDKKNTKQDNLTIRQIAKLRVFE